MDHNLDKLESSVPKDVSTQVSITSFCVDFENMLHIFKSSKLSTIKEVVAVCFNKLTRFIDKDKNTESKTKVFILPLILIVHLLWRSMYYIMNIC